MIWNCDTGTDPGPRFHSEHVNVNTSSAVYITHSSLICKYVSRCIFLHEANITTNELQQIRRTAPSVGEARFPPEAKGVMVLATETG